MPKLSEKRRKDDLFALYTYSRNTGEDVPGMYAGNLSLHLKGVEDILVREIVFSDDKDVPENLLDLLETLWYDAAFADRVLNPVKNDLEAFCEMGNDEPKYFAQHIYDSFEEARDSVRNIVKHKAKEAKYSDVGGTGRLDSILNLLAEEEKDRASMRSDFGRKKKELAQKIYDHLVPDAEKHLTFTNEELHRAFVEGRAVSKGFGPNFCFLSRRMWRMLGDTVDSENSGRFPGSLFAAGHLFGCAVQTLDHVPLRYIEFKFLPYVKTGSKVKED